MHALVRRASVLLFATLLAACAQPAATPAPTTAPAPATEQRVVGLVMKSLANEFFKNMQDGAIAHVKDRGDLRLIPVGMQSETDVETQVNAVENFISQKVDAIVIAPVDSESLTPVIAKAIEAGIVVVNIDVELDPALTKQYNINPVFVGPDNREGARLSGEVMAQALGEGGKVVILEGKPEAANAQQRLAGFQDAATAGKLEVLEVGVANWEAEQAETVMTELLAKYPDLQGVMASNDSMALGAAAAIDAAGLTGKIKIVGFDNIPAVKPLLESGVMLATVDQFGADMASNGIDYAMRILQGEQLSGWVKTPVELVK